MKFLIIGMGSMGKRRIRCLQALQISTKNIAGVDTREDRRYEANNKYNIPTYAQVDTAIANHQPDALIISVPPDVHHIFMKLAVEQGLPFFVEASVVDTNMLEIINACKTQNLVAAPSSTLHFHPGITLVRNLIHEGKLGKISNILYHSGQYLPDWHTYEQVDEFYVSNPATGGGREIVPFELTWLVDILGFPQRATGFFRKTINIKGAEKIDDTYNCLFDYGQFLLNLTVDVVSRCATRRLCINGDKGQLRWDWDDNHITVYSPEKDSWTILKYDPGSAHPEYNANIGETMYIDEIKAFINAIRGTSAFPNTLENDYKVLQTLYAVEESDKTSKTISVNYSF